MIPPSQDELVSLRPDLSLATSRVFMIHSGGDSQRLPCQSVCGKAWSAFPVLNTASYNLEAPIDLLLQCLLKTFEDVDAGLVIASSDVLLELPPPDGSTSYRWPQTGATGLAVPVSKSYGPNHGVYHVDSASGASDAQPVTKFFQKAPVEELAAAGAVRPDDTVLLDTGVIYFSPPATALLLELARTPPLHACSYLALDTNSPPLRVELYSDIVGVVLCLCLCVCAFVSAVLSPCFSPTRVVLVADARHGWRLGLDESPVPQH